VAGCSAVFPQPPDTIKAKKRRAWDNRINQNYRNHWNY